MSGNENEQVVAPSPPPPEGSEATLPSNPGEVREVGRDEFESIRKLITAVTVVVSAGFLTMLLTAYNERRASYNQLLERVTSSEVEYNKKLEELNYKIKSLEKK